jgi:hypothetical protein
MAGHSRKGLGGRKNPTFGVQDVFGESGMMKYGRLPANNAIPAEIGDKSRTFLSSE